MRVEKPVISVLMPVHNGEKYIKEALSSILRQTFTHFEVIIVDDACTDETIRIIESLKDARIIVIHNKLRKGLSESRQIGISRSGGEYIAFLDSDDYSDKNRIQIQLNFFRKNPEIGFCGTWVAVVDEKGKPTGQIWKHSTSNNRLSSLLFFRNCFSQSSIMIRKKILPYPAFRKKFEVAPDFDLWSRLSPQYKCANIPRTLTNYRIHDSNMSHTVIGLFEEEGKKIFKSKMSSLNIYPTEEELSLHDSIERYPCQFSAKKLNDAFIWLKKLVQANKLHSYLPIYSFESVIADYWFKICLGSITYAGKEGEGIMKRRVVNSVNVRRKLAYRILPIFNKDSVIDISSYQWEKYIR